MRFISIVSAPFALASFAALVACSSIASLREGGPRDEFHSKRTVEDASTCIVDAWSQKRVSVSVVPTSGGNSVQLNSESGPPVMFVDVLADGDGSKARIYSQVGSGGWFSEAAKTCN